MEEAFNFDEEEGGNRVRPAPAVVVDLSTLAWDVDDLEGVDDVLLVEVGGEALEGEEDVFKVDEGEETCFVADALAEPFLPPLPLGSAELVAFVPLMEFDGTEEVNEEEEEEEEGSVTGEEDVFFTLLTADDTLGEATKGDEVTLGVEAMTFEGAVVAAWEGVREGVTFEA